jgi:hypothetical protein
MRPYKKMDMLGFYVKWLASFLALLLGIGSIKGLYILSYLGLFGGIGLISFAVILTFITCIQYTAEKHDMRMNMVARSMSISIPRPNTFPNKMFTPSPANSESDSVTFAVEGAFFSSQEIITPHRKGSIFNTLNNKSVQGNPKKFVKFSDDCKLMDGNRLPPTKSLSRNNTE